MKKKGGFALDSCICGNKQIEHIVENSNDSDYRIHYYRCKNCGIKSEETTSLPKARARWNWMQNGFRPKQCRSKTR